MRKRQRKKDRKRLYDALYKEYAPFARVIMEFDLAMMRDSRRMFEKLFGIKGVR